MTALVIALPSHNFTEGPVTRKHGTVSTCSTTDPEFATRVNETARGFIQLINLTIRASKG